MKCPYCGSELSVRDRCDRCGEDVSKFKKLIMISNRLYNSGLEKARVRDLTGAEEDLRNCLQLNKKHTEARNVLGLCYYESGEVVAAIREWVISRNFQEENNEAEQYLAEIQDNPARLDKTNQIIKKYNGALQSARVGSGDLAIIQLKKVVAMNPHYVKAQQLLALLYMRDGDRRKAKRCLDQAAKVDIANPTTLQYLGELARMEEPEETENNDAESAAAESIYVSGGGAFAPADSFREDKPSFLPWINLVVGIVIGIAFFMIAVMPGIRADVVETNRQEIVALNESLSKANADLDEVVSERDTLQLQVDNLTAQVQSLTPDDEKTEEDTAQTTTQADQDAAEKTLLQAASYYVMGDNENCASELLKVSKDILREKRAVTLYNNLSEAVFYEQSASVYEQGNAIYNEGEYDESIKLFEQALVMNPNNVDAIYFMGRAYDRKEMYDEARKWYQRVVDEFPDSDRASQASEKLYLLP